MEIEKGSTRSHSVENSLSKRLWTCRKAAYGMSEAKHYNKIKQRSNSVTA
jgi:hypothetical protein